MVRNAIGLWLLVCPLAACSFDPALGDGPYPPCPEAGCNAACACLGGYCVPEDEMSDPSICQLDCIDSTDCDSGLDCVDGVCLPFDPCRGDTVCAGQHRECEDDQGTAVCGGCLEGYHEEGDACAIDEQCGPASCSGHGICDDATGTVVCVCDLGYAGARCESCDFGYEDFGSGCVWFWASIAGGTAMLGSDTGDANEGPQHRVTIAAFEMSTAEVTVVQYGACVDAGTCTPPSQCYPPYYNWGVPGREDFPVNCVSWSQAAAFCAWVGGRLPSEAEWEYAARSEGQEITYPWGDELATCTYAVMEENGRGCGADRTWAVCSKPLGHTQQGLCDMAGNVYEWVQDCFHGSYDCVTSPDAENCAGGGAAPADGSAWEEPDCPVRVIRGGGFVADAFNLRVSDRYWLEPDGQNGSVGFRCAR
ncbi:MAG: formylglycine-generating enzyme family protein [Deltaproteobacteria bacterium]|nr:formylglycine-generating enzyme family protein [Deltaproteobacteria bacterium]